MSMPKQTLILGFYHLYESAVSIRRKLKRQRDLDSVLIYHSAKKTVVIESNRLRPWRQLDQHYIEKFSQLLLPNEVLLILLTSSKDLKKIIDTMREIRNDIPATFIFTPEEKNEKFLSKDVLPQQPLTLDHLEQNAESLARKFSVAESTKQARNSLLLRLEKSAKIFHRIYESLNSAAQLEQNILLSSEWLLDNAYAVEAYIEEIRLNLPAKFYNELPELAVGPMAGLPRIYGIAIRLVAGTDGRLNRENITAFLNAFQTISPLNIGELWAFPLILKLRLIECLQYLALDIIKRHRESQEADFWANRILSCIRQDPEHVYLILSALSKAIPSPSTNFADQLIDHLCEEESVLPLVRKWLERKLGNDLLFILQAEQALQTQAQTSLSNAITSLHKLSQVDWRDVFEEVSYINDILSKEAALIYKKMDFDTRDLYRHHIEEIAKKAKISEIQAAHQAVALTQSGDNDLTKHIGYYLIDKGRPLLEESLGYHPSFLVRLKNLFLSSPTFFYLLSIALFIGAFLGLETLAAIRFSVKTQLIWIFGILSIIPASELAIQLINFCLAHILRPTILPKMSFKKGVPDECRSIVIVPTMLQNEESIKQDLIRLEIRYLANCDGNIRFGIFSDFSDAPEKDMPEDAKLLDIAIKGIDALNAKYPEKSFFLFHRERKWNEKEKCWMGWERKRGKIEQLNRFLLGTDPECDSLVHAGDPAKLLGIQFVITLDADTQLPRNKARNLIETLAHPLNRPFINKEKNVIERGYTIIQPRVSTSFSNALSTTFSSIFSDPSGTDPYSKAISDIYQDLFKEGVYHGKGIYDLKTFHQILDKRLAENHILSHDLLEGCYTGVGFASDIELLDLFPNTYITFCKRMHRWIRGDWQIIDWLFPSVSKDDCGKESNPLSTISRWKIFDNLRRSLVPLNLVLLLLVSWFSIHPGFGTIVAISVLLIPFFFQMANFATASLQYWLVNKDDFLKKLLKALLSITLLPHQAYIYCDAIIRSIYRRWVSKQLKLEWEISDSRQQKRKYLDSIFIKVLWFISFVSLTILVTLEWMHYPFINWGAPILILWIFSPIINIWLNRPIVERAEKKLRPDEIIFLRKLGRKIWRYFDDFIGPQTNWLPPDNYQEILRVELAKRTSSTNIGLYFVSIFSAYDFGYLTFDDVIDRIDKTIKTLQKLEFYEGHLLNWYDIETLHPLFPKYVSTVDSGNMLASLWTVEEGLKSLIDAPLINQKAIEGAKDNLKLLHDAMKKYHFHESILLQEQIEIISTLVSLPSPNLLKIVQIFHEIQSSVCTINEILQRANIQHEQIVYWTKQLGLLVSHWKGIVDNYLPWLSLLFDEFLPEITAINKETSKWIEQALYQAPTLSKLAAGNVDGLCSFLQWIDSLNKDDLSSEIKNWMNRLHEASLLSKKNAEEKIKGIQHLLAQVEKLSEGMNMEFLYNPERKLFSIGYNVNDRRLDNSYYDLLASEARLASLVAIGRGDTSTDHWWALGRPFGNCLGHIVLQSWGGTMFEYLMPLIFTRKFENSLLDFACNEAVICQIAYGVRRNIPWGISESAYSGLDIHRIYQYRAFGVPGLGLKRGLENDLVVTPYSSALALHVSPSSAINNLKKLASSEAMWGEYGFYEAIDYSRQHSPKGKRGVIIYAYMAHHLGMSLASIDNLLNDKKIQRLFHSHPRTLSVESLLYERPTAPNKKEGHLQEPPLPKLTPLIHIPFVGSLDTAQTPYPYTHLLSNGSYTVMVTNSGGGYSRYKDIDITRWRADSTCDSWGSFLYIKDLEKNSIFSSTIHPTGVLPKNYSINFVSDKAEFRRTDFGIETVSDIYVSPEDNVEIRIVTLGNLSMRTRYLELTSYMELAIAPHTADCAHPVFNKLFIETEAIPSLQGLLAFRRLRSPSDSSLCAMHIVAHKKNEEEDFEYETSRSAFIGRGSSLANPAAMQGRLTNSIGYVLDPIFCIRKQIKIEPGRRIKIAFITGIADSKQDAIKLMEKYSEFHNCQRAMEMAWTHAELNLRHLHIKHEQGQLFQKLASQIIYPQAQLRASPERLRRNKLGQARLWTYGISGDLPLMLVTINNSYDLDIIQQILICHAFWSMHGLKCDLLILNEEHSSYEQTLNESLQRIIQAYSQYTGINKPGGIFLRLADQISQEDLDLLYTVAHVVLAASRGNIRQHLSLPMPSIRVSPPLLINPQIKEEPSPPLPFLELLYFNGIGGFTKDGKEYAIYLGTETKTPAPWINVIANKQFGTMLSERGLGASWFGNSQSNRLTPWSNDPLTDPISDVIYIRDEELGAYWSVTSGPIHEVDPYRTRHGQGYTVYEHNSHAINQELTVFVPVKEEENPPIRIQRLKLKNVSSRQRFLSITSYSQLVMGVNHEDSQRYVITSWDAESKSLFAINTYHPDFGDCVLFSSCHPPAASYTGSRSEFIGRNGSLNSPAAMKRARLSGSLGAALDPCAVLQTFVELYPGEETEVLFYLGECHSTSEARELLKKYKDGQEVNKALQATKEWWDKVLTTIQVETPDQPSNLLLNRWLVYQNLSCRIWGRSAFYQSGGAFGFRDQLQDVSALLYILPHVAKEQIVRAASRQYIEGDVQHWWHPPSGGGVRTMISDDLLWLPYVTLQYIQATGEETLLDEKIPFLEGRNLEGDEHEIFYYPTQSKEQASLLDHCTKAINKALKFGPHGLPLIGGGDWNDGMNWVGINGKGESVWLAWFLIQVMKDFSNLLVKRGNKENAEKYNEAIQNLTQAIENNAWDGEWYLRAYFDDGTPIGSKSDTEAIIDSLPQSWSIISGSENLERSKIAMQAVEKYLIKEAERLVLLFTPPFDHSSPNPGYIMGYPPGVRENGGQYTHAALWVAMAYARMKDGNKAVNILQILNPINRTTNLDELSKYKVEPYVVAADIYSLPGQVGHGGWTWYTGSAGLMYRVWLEEILGFKLTQNILRVDPTIPKEWKQFTIRYRYQRTIYTIVVDNPKQVSQGVINVKLDNVEIPNFAISLSDDGKNHTIHVEMG